MDVDEVLTAQELWGWPVDVLDELWILRDRAWDGEITLEQWRERDAAIRAGRPPADRDEVRELRIAWIENPPDEVPDDVQSRVLHRLMALSQPAPSDDELWQELERVVTALGDPKLRHARLLDKLRAGRDRVESWLIRDGGGIDMMSGLPWSQIARYRVVDEPGLGPVPQHVDAARKLAMRDASEADRKRAVLLAGDRDRTMAGAVAEMSQHVLTGLVALLRDAADEDEELVPVLADQLNIWTDPRLQRLLLRETAQGWPASLASGQS
ncbi:hypothetical protein [Amycolatopsis sp. NPDC004378]